MFEEDTYLLDFLDKDIAEARKDIKEGKGLTQKGAMSMLLKGMYNHIAHLDKNMVTKAEFNSFKDQVEKNMVTKAEFISLKSEFISLRSEFKFIKWFIIFGFTILAVLQMILAFVI